MKNNYYLIQAKCGHVGRNSYVLKELPIIAESGTEAASKARWTPRVKHHDKFAIQSVTKVNKEEYDLALQKHNMDAYFQCKSVQDQKTFCIDVYKNVKSMDENSDENYELKKKSKYKTMKAKLSYQDYEDEIDEYESYLYEDDLFMAEA